MNTEVYVLDAIRTPIGKFGGGFANLSATELGTIVIKTLLERNPQIKEKIDEVIMGNVLSAGLGQNPSRIAAINGGVREEVPAFTVNQVCGSGLKSIIIGITTIQNQDAEVILAGGMENMSRAPYLLENYRFGSKFGNQIIKDSMMYDGLYCSLIGEPMGITAENIAKKYNVSRERQDKFSLASHRKAIKARKTQRFAQEMVHVETKKGSVTQDEQPREDTSYEKLQKLSPVFKNEGTVTAGNASSLNDAASAVFAVSADFIKRHKLKPMARIVSSSSIGLNPNIMGLGAYYAAEACLKKVSMKSSDIDLWEINEAFASQAIAVIDLLKVDEKKINVNGGALALGHPIGASGARILTTLLYELKKRSKQFGLATLCIGGGQGVAIIVENV